MSEKTSSHPRHEKTVVLVKPDGVKRGLVGEILARFEKRGLKIIALKMVKADEIKAKDHYPGTDEWLSGMGNKTLSAFKEYDLDVKEMMGTEDPLEIGKMVQEWNVSYLSEGPVVAIILEGMHAISTVRKLVGHTLPILADPGTIRGDYSVDTNTAANLDQRAIRNVIHASGDQSEADFELKHWFDSNDKFEYPRADEGVMFS